MVLRDPFVNESVRVTLKEGNDLLVRLVEEVHALHLVAGGLGDHVEQQLAEMASWEILTLFVNQGSPLAQIVHEISGVLAVRECVEASEVGCLNLFGAAFICDEQDTPQLNAV